MALLQKLGAAGLGIAQGTVIINTANLRGAAAVARNVGNQIRAGLSPGTAAARQQAGAFGVLRGELVRLSLATAGFFAVGTGAAAYYEEAMVVLTGMTRSQTKAIELNEKIRDTARDMGVAYGEVLHATRLILPTMEGQTDELESQWSLIRRVAVLNPAQGVAMAAFAVNEALVSGGRDLMSLAERFNVSRGIFREEFAKSNRDFWGALDKTLERMGITQDVAEEMAGTFTASFNIARDAVTQLVAAGFEPLLQYLNPLLRMAADWAAGARDSHQTTLAWAAGLTTLGTVAIPLIGIIVKLGGAIKGLAGMSMLGPAGLGAAIGGVLGFGIVRAHGRSTGDERNANYGLEEFTSDARHSIVELSFTLVRTLDAVDEAFVNTRVALYDFIGGIYDILGRIGFQIAQILPEGMSAGVREGSEKNFALADLYRASSKQLRENSEERSASRSRRLAGFVSWLQPPSKIGMEGERYEGDEFNQDQISAMEKWAAGVVQIEEKAAADRLKLTEQYESQRTKTVADYALQRAREEEDYARGRARQNAEHTRSVADIREDGAEQEAEWWEDYYDNQKDKREEASKKFLEIEEKYQENRAKLLRDHREKLLKAASRLDAAGVAEEQRRFATRLNDLEANYKKSNKTQKDKLKEEEKDALEALEKRIRRAREADEKRILDMEEDLARRQGIEDEDRALRQERQRADHLQQLADMEQQYIDKMVAVDIQEEKARIALDDKFRDEMIQLNLFNVEYMRIQQEAQDASIEMWKKYWGDWTQTLEDAKKVEALKDITGIVDEGGEGRGFIPERFATGGPVNRTGLALVHAGEYVLNPSTVNAMQGALGGSFNQGDILNRGVNIAAGAIQIYGAEGQDINQLGQIVRAELIAALQYAG